ncbi:protein of unknown function [Nitrospira defluvii]|uniref:Uncharacterized protein n=1 Tax=Nitrospira defluvii TaxID=330214 RepID=D8PJD9_9BACT|nr:protein of unknown function [Nitrospira defluvii]
MPVGTAVDAVLVKVDARDDQLVQPLKDCRTLLGQSAAPVLHTRAGRFFISPAGFLHSINHSLLSAVPPFHENS